DKVNTVFSINCICNLIFGGLLILLFCLKAPDLAYFLGARDTGVKKMASAYIYGLSIGGLPMLFNATLSRFSRMFYDAKILSVSMGIMSLSDIVLDVLFAGVFKMGMFGMALASSMSYILSVMCMLVMMSRQRSDLKLCRPKNFFRELKSIVVMGCPDALNSGCSVVSSVFVNNLLVTLGGTAALSARTVQSGITSMTTSVVMGVGFTLAPFIGILWGERDGNAIEKALRRGLWLGLRICLVMCVIVCIAANPLCRLFGVQDEATIGMSVAAVRYAVAGGIFGSVNCLFLYYYQSIGKIWISNMITAARSCIYVVLFIFLTQNILGVTAVWISSLIAEGFTMMTLILMVWLMSRKFPRGMRSYLFLPPEFQTKNPVYEVSIRNDLDVVITLSGKIHAFCLEHNVEPRKAYYAALCIEEMAANVVQYGFQKDRQHFLDIRIMIEKDNIFFRMRDDGVRFNPFEYIEMRKIDEEDRYLFNNIGIRMVKRLAIEMDYRYSVGMNYLFVTI
ncbi:MAG: ATP-binding protein, partial [Lachnospiraceae bacterium]|nr:ATP-binding protein [Lachnospiraceae bacterium]